MLLGLRERYFCILYFYLFFRFFFFLLSSAIIWLVNTVVHIKLYLNRYLYIIYFKVMPTSCSAYGCTNRLSKNNPRITFHSFPKDEKRKEKWIQAVGRPDWKPSRFSRLCSEHFAETDIDRTSLSCVRIKENAVPTIFKHLPTISKRPIKEKSIHFDHITFWVGNAKQAASYYCTKMGFEYLAYRGLETGSREVVAHAVKQNRIIFVFTSPLNPGNKEMGTHLAKHGDGVKDIAFRVENLDLFIKRAKLRGSKIVKDIWEETDDCGTVRFAVVQKFRDTTHSFIERKSYNGLFLPGYHKSLENDCLLQELSKPGLNFIDHCVGNLPDNTMNSTKYWYMKNLMHHRFWCDDSKIHTRCSDLRLILVKHYEKSIKFPPRESSKKKSEIQEYMNYYDAVGVQHISLNTDNIIDAVTILKNRGMEFLTVSDSYYETLRETLKAGKMKVSEDMDTLQKLKILVNFDDNGYLLQIFTKPLQDRPTLFLEIIQRH